MRYIAAYLLASFGGKSAPTAADLEKILGSVGIEAESDKINRIISEFKGKNIEELITLGSAKLASVPSGGAAAPVAAVAASEKAAAPAAAPAAGKKEEKKEESEESEDDMGFGLFD